MHQRSAFGGSGGGGGGGGGGGAVAAAFGGGMPVGGRGARGGGVGASASQTPVTPEEAARRHVRSRAIARAGGPVNARVLGRAALAALAATLVITSVGYAGFRAGKAAGLAEANGGDGAEATLQSTRGRSLDDSADAEVAAAEAAAEAAESAAAAARHAARHGDGGTGATDGDVGDALSAKEWLRAASGELVIDEYISPRAGRQGDLQASCADERSECPLWKEQGECVNNRIGLHALCARTCGWCENATARMVEAATDRVDEAEARRLSSATWRRSAHSGLGAGMEAPIQVLSWRPARAFLIANLFSEAECDHLIALGEPAMAASQTAAETESAEAGKASTIRTSTSADISGWLRDDPVVRATEARIARLSRLPVENQETYQLLHYKPGAFYVPHEDWFGIGHMDLYAPSSGDRVVTVLVYLTDVEEGGETYFPHGIPLDADGNEVHGAECMCGGERKPGLSVPPRKGWAIMFHDYHPNGTHAHALHSGCRVLKGDKRTATKWIRSSYYNRTEQEEAYEALRRRKADERRERSERAERDGAGHRRAERDETRHTRRTLA